MIIDNSKSNASLALHWNENYFPFVIFLCNKITDIAHNDSIWLNKNELTFSSIKSEQLIIFFTFVDGRIKYKGSRIK